MIKKISSEILENYYLKAIKSYKRCVEKSENSFLSNEIGFSVHELELENEVKLNLLSNDLNLGYYISVLNEEENEIDDYLVFN
jgi:hypothetical protein